MPVRMLKPGLRTSEKFNRCSWMAQSAYIRILTMVDDYGRYLANPKLLRSELFPFGDDRGADIPLPRIETVLSELVRTGLITVYETESKSFLQVTSWTERIRSESKYPEPQSCGQLPTIDSKCQQPLASPPTPTPTPTPTPEQVVCFPDALKSEDFKKVWEDWITHLKQKRKPPTKLAVERQLKKLSQMGEKKAIETLNHCIEKNWQGIYEKPEQSKRPLSVMEMRSVLEAKKTEAANLKNKFCNEGPLSTTWSNEKARLECAKLFSEIKQLNHQLASMA